MSDTTTTKFEYYKYDPSVAAAVIFVILFLCSTAFHIWQMIKRRTYFFIPFIIGGLCKCIRDAPYSHPSNPLPMIVEFVGYAGRAESGRQSPEWTLVPYLIQSLLLLLGPSFFAASIYMILGRIIRLTDGEAHSMIRTRWLTAIFVTGDVLSFFVQSGGASTGQTSTPFSPD